MPITGNPKRPFLSRKDAIVVANPTDPQQLTQSLQATRDSLTQVERFLNARGVACRAQPGSATSVTFNPQTSTFQLPFRKPTNNPSPMLAQGYDPGNMINSPTAVLDTSAGTVNIGPTSGSIFIIEPGIYMCMAQVVLNNLNTTTAQVQGFWIRTNSTGVRQDAWGQEAYVGPNQSVQLHVVATVNCSYGDALAVYARNETPPSVASYGYTTQVAATKISDFPTINGQ